MSLPAGVRVAWRAAPPGVPRREISRALLRELLPDASFVSRCPSCGGDHGRIRVEGMDAAASVSYVPGWALAAVAHDRARIGLDAVPADAGGLERVLPGAADSRAWARAEAVLKAEGRGLRVDPSRVTVRATADGWVAWITEPAQTAQTADRIEWRGWDIDGPAGVVVAVAVD